VVADVAGLSEAERMEVLRAFPLISTATVVLTFVVLAGSTEPIQLVLFEVSKVELAGWIAGLIELDELGRLAGGFVGEAAEARLIELAEFVVL